MAWGPWTSGTLPWSHNAQAAACNPAGQWMVVGLESGGTNVVAQGTNIASLSSATLPSTGTWNAVVWTGTAWLVGTSGLAVLSRSTNGTTWSNKTLYNSSATIVVCGSRIVALGYGVATASYSTDDGLTWTSFTVNAVGATASAYNGSVAVTISTAGTTTMYSSNGFSTYGTATLPATCYWVVWDATNSVFVAGTTAGQTYYSSNGTSWSTGGAVGFNCYKLAYSAIDRCLYAVEYAGTHVKKSTDGGLTWSADSTLPSTANWFTMFEGPSSQIVSINVVGTAYAYRSFIPSSATISETLANSTGVINATSKIISTISETLQNAAGVIAAIAHTVVAISETLQDATGVIAGNNGGKSTTISEILQDTTGTINAAIKNLASISETLAGATGNVQVAVTLTVTEPFFVSLTHPNTGAALTGLGNATVYLEIKNTSRQWYNFTTLAFQASPSTTGTGTRPYLTEDVSGHDGGGYYLATDADVTILNGWVTIRAVYSYDSGDGRGTVRYVNPEQAYYVNGTRQAPGVSAEVYFWLSAMQSVIAGMNAQFAAVPIANRAAILGDFAALPSAASVAAIPTAAANAAAGLERYKRVLNPADGTLKLYDSTGTLVYSGLAYMDAAGTQLYDGTASVHHTTWLA